MFKHCYFNDKGNYFLQKKKDIANFDDHTNQPSVPHSQVIHLQRSQGGEENVAAVTEEVIMGFDYDFVETPPPDGLTCKICHFPAREPQQTNVCCGQTFCAACLQKYLGSNILDNNRCPYCNEVPFKYAPDIKTNRAVGDLKVYCPHKLSGCNWVNELRSLEQHITTDNKRGCPFTELQCSNGCGVVMQRRLVEGHLKSECELREVNCEYCNTTGSYQWINSSHQEECPKYPVECPNHCEVGHVRREEMGGHLEECPRAITKCLFGCGGVVRADATEHMKQAMTSHMEQMLRHIEQLKSTKEDLENEIHKIQIKLDDTNHTIKDNHKIVTINNQVTRDEVEKAKGRLTNHDNKLDDQQKKIEALKQKITELEEKQVKLIEKNEELQSQIKGVRQDAEDEITKRAQEIEAKLKAKVEKVVADKNAELEELKTKLQEHEKARRQEHENLQAAKDKFKVQLQSKEEELRQELNNGLQKYKDNFETLLCLQDWSLRLNYFYKTCTNILPNVYVKITDFNLRVKIKDPSKWSSKPFYTSNKGYKMFLSVSPTGLSNSHMSVCVKLMNGEHDNHLRWPIKGTLKIQLMNLVEDSNHADPVEMLFDGAEDNSSCQRVLAGSTSRFGILSDKFISHKSLSEFDSKKNKCLHKDDTLFLRVLEFVDHHQK